MQADEEDKLKDQKRRVAAATVLLPIAVEVKKSRLSEFVSAIHPNFICADNNYFLILKDHRFGRNLRLATETVCTELQQKLM